MIVTQKNVVKNLINHIVIIKKSNLVLCEYINNSNLKTHPSKGVLWTTPLLKREELLSLFLWESRGEASFAEKIQLTLPGITNIKS